MTPATGTRQAAMEMTRERILDVALEQFYNAWYDDVTLRGIADAAGVALQTVVNHFGSKEGLFVVVGERVGETIAAARWSVEEGDVDGAIATLVGDYERNGDASVRTLAVEEKVAVVRPMIDLGRRGHEAWVQHAFPAALEGLTGVARSRRIGQLVAVTDVYTWKILRRDKRLSVRQVQLAMRELVLALHHPPSKEPP